MKDINQAVYEHLIADTDVKALVDDRIYPVLMPEDAYLPAIVYTPLNASYDSALQGDTGFVKQTVQFVCHGESFKKARELSRKVKKAIQDLHGDVKGLYIEAVFIKTDFELSGNTALKFDTDEYMYCLEFEFHFNEKE